jgi:hypothetical protein
MFDTDLIDVLRKRPFVPFRIRLSDGTVYDVRHPELVMVGLGSAIIGIPPAGKTQPIFERTENVSLEHIVKLVPLPASAMAP